MCCQRHEHHDHDHDHDHDDHDDHDDNHDDGDDDDDDDGGGAAAAADAGGDKDPLLKKTSFTEPGARRNDIIPVMDERRWVETDETETGLIAQM